MNDLPFHLQLAVDPLQAGTEQFPALFLDQLGMNDDIGQPAFVLQGH